MTEAFELSVFEALPETKGHLIQRLEKHLVQTSSALEEYFLRATHRNTALLLQPKKFERANQISCLTKPVVGMTYLSNIDTRKIGAENCVDQVNYYRLSVVVINDYLVEILKILKVISQKRPELICKPALDDKLAEVLLLVHAK